MPANLFSNPSTMPPTRGYTHVVETVSPSRTIYLSGQLGMMPDGKFAGAPDVGAAPPVLQEGEKSGRRPCTARTVSANRLTCQRPTGSPERRRQAGRNVDILRNTATPAASCATTHQSGAQSRQRTPDRPK